MASLVKLRYLFSIEYGNQFDKNKLIESRSGVNFVSRTTSNLGIESKVEIVPEVVPYELGLMTATLGRTYLLSTFIQPGPFYTGQNIKVLRPLNTMTFNEKAFYCLAISQNRFRYTSHGREANKTFDDIAVPPFSSLPNWVNTVSIPSPENAPIYKTNMPLETESWRSFRYDEIFEIRKGQRLTQEEMIAGDVPFIGAIDHDNGMSHSVGQKAIFKGNTITVNYDGNGVAEAYYQSKPYWALDSVNVLYPKFSLTPFIAMFLCALIRQEKFRFNYGRKWHLERMKESIIGLPSTLEGAPDWSFMENFIKSLSYSKNI